MTVNQMVAFCERNQIDDDDLNDGVCVAKAAEAAVIKVGGVRDQLDYLVESYGYEHVQRALESIAKKRVQ